MITFESKEEFEDAVMAVLAARMDAVLNVSLEYNGDYYNPTTVPSVEIFIRDNKPHEEITTICYAEGKA